MSDFTGFSFHTTPGEPDAILNAHPEMESVQKILKDAEPESSIASWAVWIAADLGAAQHQEGWLVGGHGHKKAAECIKYGKCEEACPQHISIREQLETASEALG